VSCCSSSGIWIKIRTAIRSWRADKSVASNFTDYAKRAEARAAKAGPPYRRCRFHDRRQLSAVDYPGSGRGGIYDLQRLLDHASINTTKVCLDHLTTDEAELAIDRFGAEDACSTLTNLSMT
jgi:integrase